MEQVISMEYSYVAPVVKTLLYELNKEKALGLGPPDEAVVAAARAELEEVLNNLERHLRVKRDRYVTRTLLLLLLLLLLLVHPHYCSCYYCSCWYYCAHYYYYYYYFPYCYY
jgi:hypothetical protein